MPPVYIFLATAGFISAVWLAGRRIQGGRGFGVLSLNLLSALLLLSLVFRPEISIRVAHKEKAALCLLLDTSLSMGLAGNDGKTRIEKAVEYITSEPLLKEYDVTFYTAGEKLRKTEGIEGLDGEPSGFASLILDGLEELNETAGGVYEAVLLFTDGQESRVGEMASCAGAFRTPVLAVGMGGDTVKDVSITGIMSNSPVYAGESARIEVFIRQSGFDGGRKRVVLEENGRVIQEKEVFLEGTERRVVFEIPALPAGQKIYEVKVDAGEEKINANNAMPVFVRAVSPRINMLYVEGSLRWEYKFLKRFIESNPNLSPVFLVRVGENIFQYAGEKKAKAPADIFADTQFLEKFSIIIMGDIGFSSFTPHQRKNLRDFFEVKGKSLLFLGGENFLEGVKDTELEEVVPVLFSGEEQKVSEGRFMPQITGEGRTLPVFSGREEGFPSLSRANNVYGVKRAAVSLLAAEKERLPYVLSGLKLSAEGGRSIFVATDDTWRWMFGSEEEKNAYRFFWGRLIRYMWTPEDSLGIGKTLPEIRTDRNYCAPGEQVEVSFSYQKEGKRQPFEAFLRTPGGKVHPVAVNDLKAFFIPEKKGIHIMEAVSEGKRNFLPILVMEEGGEFMETGRNEAFLKQVAEESGGAYVPFEDIEVLKGMIKKEKKYTARNLALTQVSRRYAILLLFAMLNIAWHLRRRAGAQWENGYGRKTD